MARVLSCPRYERELSSALRSSRLIIVMMLRVRLLGRRRLIEYRSLGGLVTRAERRCFYRSVRDALVAASLFHPEGAHWLVGQIVMFRGNWGDDGLGGWVQVKVLSTTEYDDDTVTMWARLL